MTKKNKLQSRIEFLKVKSNDLIWFGRQVITKWVFWIFLILDVIAVIVVYFAPKLQVPQYVYIVFALIGFFWAAFKVNQDLLIKYNALSNDPSKAVLPPKTSLSITLTEGNEYTYKISAPEDETAAYYLLKQAKESNAEQHYDENGVLYINDQPFYVLPHSEIFINPRIENDGNVPLDILVIESTCSHYDDNSPFQFIWNRVRVDEKNVTYPHHLEPGEIFLCKISHEVHNKLKTTAQFAASIRDMDPNVKSIISIDTLDQNGTRKTLELRSTIATRPLIDLYIAQWQTYKQSELLRLAGIGNN
jgi:hypothetical protein